MGKDFTNSISDVGLSVLEAIFRDLLSGLVEGSSEGEKTGAGTGKLPPLWQRLLLYCTVLTALSQVELSWQGLVSKQSAGEFLMVKVSGELSLPRQCYSSCDTCSQKME